MPSDYKAASLFGGALTVDLPTTFADVSTIRQVPDNQEVFLDKEGFTSIIFDITERVGRAGSSDETDGAALTAHLDDIVDSETETLKVWSSTRTKFSRLPQHIPAYTLIATQTPVADPDKAQRNSSPDFTAIVLNLVRLEKEDTDVVVTINVPHIKGEYSEEDVDLELGKQGKLITDAVDHASRIWESFQVLDWKLFQGE